MPKQIKPLSATEISSAKSKEKKYKLLDGGGLFLQVNPSGSKVWKLNYRYGGKQKEYTIGAYPVIKLAEARLKREELRNDVANGIDISQKKQQNKKAEQESEEKRENTFYKISQEWWKSYEREVSENYHIKLGRALDNYIYSIIKTKPVDEVTRKDILAILDDLKSKDLLETAKRVLNILNKVFLYAVTYEYAPHNITADIDKKVALGKIEKKHYPTFSKDKDIKGLLISIDDYNGNYYTKKALQVLPYVFVRSFNIRHMEWEEIDFQKELWIIPPYKMKVKEEFILPLPHQVIEILKEVKENAISEKYVFPSLRGKDNPMSDNTLISALRRMGYTKEEFVPHSFRAMFSTIAYEKANDKEVGHTYTGEVIESLLAHKEQNKVKSAYNRAEYIEAKRKLIQWYADYLERLKNN